jgi:adenine-specific DNA-methyltransferase
MNPTQDNANSPTREHLSSSSPDIKAELLARLQKAAPDAFVEGKLDIEKLKTLVGEAVETRAERYDFNWAGKRDAIAMLQAPTSATLVPDSNNSVKFDDAQHVLIEGENLEVLKVLYRSYFGRVKIIYIDPPYNTGEDFIYPDNFADPLDYYLRITGQKNGDGDYLTSQTERSGRFHSAWLSMMYPRLSLARQLLREDGVILISIDDHESANLRKLTDDVFGEENFVAQLVWEKGRKNDAKLFSVGHEYVLVYAKSLGSIKERRIIWREEKPGAKEIWDEYVRLRGVHDKDDKAIEKDLTNWFRDLPKTHPSKKWARYRRIDANGPWRDRDISWPGGDGPTYEVLHPETGLPCKIPEAGWRFSTFEEMQRQIKLGLVEFREDHTQPPFRKAHIRPIPDELDDTMDVEDDEIDADEEMATQVRGSYFYKQSQVAVKYLRKLMDGKVFDNPKDHDELARLFKYVLGGDKNAIILDFFAGSGATGEAVLQINSNGNSQVRFILVQLPEPCNAKERTGKAAISKRLNTIADVCRERLRRVFEKKEGKSGGLRVFKLASSNIRRWTGIADKNPDVYAAQLDAFADTLVSGWKPDHVVWEATLREGFSLTARLEKLNGAKGGRFWKVTDTEQDRAFTICLDESLTLDAVRALGLSKDDHFVCRDVALDDTLAANLALQCRLKVI